MQTTTGCDCQSGTSYKVYHDPHALELELGPAYEAYKSGNLSISRTWEQNKPLVGDWLPKCCIELSPDFQYDDLWLGHTIFLGLYLLAVLAMLITFIMLRDEQPFKFRDYKAVTILVAVLVTLVVSAVISGNEGGTSTSIVPVVVSFCGGPLVSYYYIMKDIQLSFIIAWGEAKLKKNNYDRIQQFHRFRFVLDFRFYLLGLFTVLTIAAVPAIYTVTARDVFKDSLTTNSFNTLRCEWWNIPEEYQVPKSNSGLCNCVALGSPLAGGDESLCAAAVGSICAGSADDDDEVNAGFCDVCLSNLLNPGPECIAYFTNFYLSGNCGFPAQTPHAATCLSTIYADRTMSYVCAGIVYFMLLLNAVVLIPLWGKRDDFGMITENTMSSFSCILVFFFTFSGFFPNNGGLLNWYYDDLGIQYRSAFTFTWIAGFTTIACSLGFPLTLWYYRTRWETGSEFSKKSHLELPSFSHVSDPTDENHIMYLVHNPKTEVESDLEECVRSPALLHLYSQYAVEAFHVEHVRFLEEAALLFEYIESSASMTDICLKATQIYEQFISPQAALEINIPYKLRDAIKNPIDLMLKMMVPVPDDPREHTPNKRQELHNRRVSDVLSTGAVGQLLDAVAQAYIEVRKLLARDTWPRFKRTRHYTTYLQLIEGERRVSAAVVNSGGTELLQVSSTHSLIERKRSVTSSSDPEVIPKSPQLIQRASQMMLRRGSDAETKSSEADTRPLSEADSGTI